MRALVIALSSVSLLLLAGCGDAAKLPEQASTGANPPIPEPNKSLLPTVNIAVARGWPVGERPKAAAGLVVTAFANGLDHPRLVGTFVSSSPWVKLFVLSIIASKL